MVTKRDDDRQGKYRAICLGKVGRQSFAKNLVPRGKITFPNYSGERPILETRLS